MILSVEGEAGSGKTTLAYTAPRKVVGFSFDLGTHRALNGLKYDDFFADSNVSIVDYESSNFHPVVDTAKFTAAAKEKIDWADHDITVYELPEPVQFTNRVLGCRQLFSYFLVLFGNAVQDDAVRTIVIDTATLARRVAGSAYLQELQEKAIGQGAEDGALRKQLLQIEYGHPNGMIRNIYSLMKTVKKNLIMIHHLGDEYVDVVDDKGQKVSMRSGKRIYEGVKESDRIWDVGLRASEVATKPKNGGDYFEFEYVKCGFNPSLKGTRMAGNEWNTMVSQIDGSLGGRSGLEKRITS